MTTPSKTALNTVVRQLSFATSVAAALSISACGPQQQRAGSRVCTDASGKRIPDQNCRRTGGIGGAALWYYGGAALARSNYGEKVSGGSHTAPRGGFGASARGSSGG